MLRAKTRIASGCSRPRGAAGEGSASLTYPRRARHGAPAPRRASRPRVDPEPRDVGPAARRGGAHRDRDEPERALERPAFRVDRLHARVRHDLPLPEEPATRDVQAELGDLVPEAAIREPRLDDRQDAEHEHDRAPDDCDDHSGSAFVGERQRDGNRRRHSDTDERREPPFERPQSLDARVELEAQDRAGSRRQPREEWLGLDLRALRLQELQQIGPREDARRPAVLRDHN